MRRRITLMIVAMAVALCTTAVWIGSPAGASVRKISPTASPTGGGRVLHK